mmetsp:Transcript_28765/g.43911  ORF Transcript_28765/g.43911 Transcript_28765/m.43911 type:complete len:544 (+) Transcript_28765:79-1710(+)
MTISSKVRKISFLLILIVLLFYIQDFWLQLDEKDVVKKAPRHKTKQQKVSYQPTTPSPRVRPKNVEDARVEKGTITDVKNDRSSRRPRTPMPSPIPTREPSPKPTESTEVKTQKPTREPSLKPTESTKIKANNVNHQSHDSEEAKKLGNLGHNASLSSKGTSLSSKASNESGKNETTTKIEPIDARSNAKRTNSSSIIQPSTVRGQNLLLDGGEEQSFFEQHCFLEESSQGMTWYPKGPTQDWQKRDPYVLLAGARHSGISEIFQKLVLQHSSLIHQNAFNVGQKGTNANYKDRPPFFLHKDFRGHIMRNHENRVNVRSARLYLQRRSTHSRTVSMLKQNETLRGVYFDSSSYIFRSLDTPVFVRCTCPWIKVVIILRNPLDQLVDYYRWIRKRDFPKTFNEWVEEDLQLLQDAGIISEKKNKHPDHDSNIRESWSTYLSTVNGGPVGRGLYEIQLRQWLEIIPAEQLFVAAYEDWQQQPQEVWNRLLEFLEVPHQELKMNPNTSSEKQKNLLDQEMQVRLKKILKPFNQRLYKMLGWQAVWD